MPKMFLLKMLLSIFVFQAAIFSAAAYHCAQVQAPNSWKDHCPELGERYEATFTVMITTTLALLTGDVRRPDV